MVCNPNDNNLNPSVIPGIPIPGFGIPIAPIQAPLPDFNFPRGFPEDLLDLINDLSINWPGGVLSPSVDDLTNTILKYIANLFSQIAPFLSLYNLIQALLNMIICIIDILCAIPNPWAMIRAVRRLIKQCLPPFLSLFPVFALILMILSILLLIIALIIYIISRIIQIIEDLIKNLQLLAEASTLQDADSVAAVAIKISSLFCIMEGLLATFSAIAAIIAIINALSNMAVAGICGGGRGGSDCCGDDVCPPFIANNPEPIFGNMGTLIYYRQINQNQPVNFFQRQESWQFVNGNAAAPYQFRDIITPLPSSYNIQGSSSNTGFGDIFWPEGISYSQSTSLRRAPYTVDLILRNFDPGVFNNNDVLGPRTLAIRNAIVEIKPYIGYLDYNNNVNNTNTGGTFRLVGGLVEENNGTPYIINGRQATIESFIHSSPSNSGQSPSSDDGYFVSNVEFLWKINHAALMDYNLITLGCLPEISGEVANINATFFPESIAARLGDDPIPPPEEVVACTSQIIAEMRANVSPENVSTKTGELVACLENYKDKVEGAFCKAFVIAVDPFKTTVELDTDLQFTTRPINVKVDLLENGGSNIGSKVPESCVPELESKLKGEVTLGEVSGFTYNPNTGAFMAQITSEEEGEGELRVSWNGNIISRVINRDDIDLNTAVEELVLPYTFIGVGDKPKERRDASDVTGGEE
jgi:hypothetical protein